MFITNNSSLNLPIMYTVFRRNVSIPYAITTSIYLIFQQSKAFHTKKEISTHIDTAISYTYILYLTKLLFALAVSIHVYTM